MNILIRKEDRGDFPNVKTVLNLAFGQKNEGVLVERLRVTSDFARELSLEAEVENRVAGYILFFPTNIKSADAQIEAPDEAFLALELAKGALKDVSGVVEYPAEFIDV